MLDQWAMNNSTNINQLKSNMAAVSVYTAPGITNQAMNGQFNTLGGSTQARYFNPNSTEDKTKQSLFG